MIRRGFFVCALCLLCLSGWGRRTTRPSLHPAAPAAEAEADTTGAVPTFVCLTAADGPEVTLAGYDKPLRSRRESFFATNPDSVRTVCHLWLTATYYDLSGRMLHRRNVAVDCMLPPGQTRRLEIPSWDSQRSFYYYLSEPPVRASGVPYKVTMGIDSLLAY